MNEQENEESQLAKPTARTRISSERWEQIKTGYAAGIGLREIARKMNIPEGTVLAHAKRHGWTQQLQAVKGELAVMQSDAITPVQSVPQSLAAIMGERKERTRLGLSKFTAEAAERAAEHPDKLLIAGKVKDVASVHSTLWPEQPQTNQILNLAILTGVEKPERSIKARECHDSND
ncbi:MAG TPA: helix-turn-helix domain-containing protein [Blastocatellia bacterium]|nr:helix-turn-helix domain-containing protein [Blastocatellia bacterium]